MAKNDRGSLYGNTRKNDFHAQWKAANWQRYRHQRVLILWEVVALSLGAEPDSKNVANARKDAQFQDSYLRRIKSLTRMMSAVPDEGPLGP